MLQLLEVQNLQTSKSPGHSFPGDNAYKTLLRCFPTSYFLKGTGLSKLQVVLSRNPTYSPIPIYAFIFLISIRRPRCFSHCALRFSAGLQRRVNPPPESGATLLSSYNCFLDAINDILHISIAQVRSCRQAHANLLVDLLHLLRDYIHRCNVVMLRQQCGDTQTDIAGSCYCYIHAKT